jgi:hypothetical protein
MAKLTPAFEELTRLKVEATRARYSAVPAHALPSPKRYSDKTTGELTRCVMDYLELRGGYAVRINVQGQARVEKIQTAAGTLSKINYTKSTTTKGTADLHATYEGKHISIEIKNRNTRDRMSPEQKEVQARVEQAGGIYYVCTCFDEFYKWFNEKFNSHDHGK